VHGHAGALLMGLAQVGLQYDVDASDRFFWYTTPSWIMWNILVSALAVGATAVLYDGSPLWPVAGPAVAGRRGHAPDPAGDQPGLPARVREGGAAPGAGARPVGAAGRRLDRLTAAGVVVPLGLRARGRRPRDARHQRRHDFAAAVVLDAPWLPVTAGEMSCRALGVDVQAWDEQGAPLVDEVGELVITTPMPSMPLRIWGDESGARLHDAYFDVYPASGATATG
jgi:acetoacetyl-CoA synthetase